MRETDPRPESEGVSKRSKGYMWDYQGWTSNAETLPYRGTPAGRGYSTLGDLLLFARALQTNALLPMAELAEATFPQNHHQDYGDGFQTIGVGAVRYYGHAGGAPGMSADFRIYPELDVVIIALSNLDPPVASKLADFYADRMPESP